jgi:phosphoribosylformylglycinamidine synthase
MATSSDNPPVRRIEIGVRAGLRDPRGEHAARGIREFLHIEVGRIRTHDVYHLEADLSAEELAKVVGELTDPVLNVAAVDRLEDGPFDVAISVAYMPGVTDPVGKSALVAIEDTLGRRVGESAAVYTSVLYLLDGVDADQAQRIALELLSNPVIQTARIQTFSEWSASEPDLTVPKMDAGERPRVMPVDLSGDDTELERISREGLLALALNEMQAIRDHYRQQGETGRRQAAGLGHSPTDVELECLAQTWSEHCKHKIFNATIDYHESGAAPETIDSLFGSYIRGTTDAVRQQQIERDGHSWLISVFHDNAGVVAFDEQIHLVYKVETHNSPSALDPYGGAMTGIVGVNRDPFGTGRGADLLVNVWGYCFASPFFTGDLPPGLLHPHRIRDGVHSGVIDGGNQSGIPYGRGWEVFDHRFLGKPLVFCGTVGSLPVEIAGTPGEDKAARPGDVIVMVGGRIGADGIHGATFSSAALDESSPAQAVQIGDPITQRMMFDFLLEARERGLYSAITDNGAGGLSSSVGEMAEKPGGARLDLAKAPLKYAGLASWEIFLSEAQESWLPSATSKRAHSASSPATGCSRSPTATRLWPFSRWSSCTPRRRCA